MGDSLSHLDDLLKAVDTAKRSGGGRTVACFFDI